MQTSAISRSSDGSSEEEKRDRFIVMGRCRRGKRDSLGGCRCQRRRGSRSTDRGELAYLFARRQAARQVRRDDVRMLCPLVFHRDGEPIGDFRKSWATACCAAGVGKLVCPTCCTDVDEEHRCQKCNFETLTPERQRIETELWELTEFATTFDVKR